ncbi:AfsR/SARP family transcriptional regulator [Nakamurella flava]|uniref:AfsR/SARP family transcriptional regulator n=1 Tax=Nakamurella flava TaxID=2576308 RepID=UPI00140DE205|nr:BTAD domain-containing putative transcriptional regulator [Nakamurella flava]
MEFRDLGPVTVEFDGAPIRLSGGRVMTVLAALLVNAGESVSQDRLIDAVWGDRLPQRAGAALDTLIFRLRQVLEPDRTRRSGWRVVVTEGNGYRLLARDQDVDSRAFVRDSADAHAALLAGAADRGLLLAERALARWRGPAYDGLPDTPWLEPVRAQLDDTRAGTGELLVQAMLDLGRPEQAVAAVQPLVLQHPFRERLWAQLALGLYRAGRQAAALETFARARRVLDEELGVSPGPDLVVLQEAMLAHAPELLGPSSVPVTVTDLPAGRRPLYGRSADVAAVTALLAPGQVASITGPVGVGKTSVAQAVAAAAAPHHRDGAHFVDLTRATTGSDVAALAAATLELRADGPDITGTLARRLQGRDILLVLDNCEHVLDAVAALVLALPATTTVLATGRESLELDHEREYRLAPLPSTGDSAVRMFLDAAGRPDDEPTDSDKQRIGAICAALGGLPLGIELAGRRARTFDLDEVLDSVRDDPGGLRPGRRDHRAGRSLADEISTSVGLCEPAEQVMHGRLSTLTGPFTLAAARAVSGSTAAEQGQVMDLLAGLTRRSLLVVEPRKTGVPTQFRQLIPIRHHAAQTLAASDDDAAARRRHWVRDLASAVPQRGRPGQRTAYDRLEADVSTISATIQELLTDPDPTTAVRVVTELVGWAYDRNRLQLARGWLTTAVARPDLDPLARALAEATLGSLLEIARETAAAHALFERSLPLLVESGDPAAVGVLVDIATTAWVGDDWAYGAEIASVARDRATAIDQPYERLIAESTLTAARLFTGPPHDALLAAEELLAQPDTQQNGRAMLMLCATAGVAAVFAGRPENGLRWTEESLRVAQDLGVRNMGETLEQRGNHLAAAGRPIDALRCFAAAATQYDRGGMSWPRHEGTATTVDVLRAAVPAEEFERTWASGARIIAAGDGVQLADWI